MRSFVIGKPGPRPGFFFILSDHPARSGTPVRSLPAERVRTLRPRRRSFRVNSLCPMCRAFLLIVLLLMTPRPALFAQETAVAPAGAPPQEDRSNPTEKPDAAGTEPPAPPAPEDQTFIDIIHAGISRSILSSSEWLDSFFYDPRYAAEENRTRMVMRVDAFDEEDRHTDISTHFQFKIRLPQLKNKAHIIISGNPDEESGDEQAAGTTGPLRFEQRQDRNVSTSAGYFFKSDARRNVNARVGVRYRNGEFVVFVRPHYRILHTVGAWSLRFTQEFPWWSDTKWQSLTAIDLERALRSDLFLRTSFIGTWTDDLHGYSYQVITSVTRPLSARRAIGCDLSSRFASRPNHHLEEIGAVVRYRQRIWRDWVYYELAPQMRFPRDRGFDLVPGLLFRLEMFFGKYN